MVSCLGHSSTVTAQAHLLVDGADIDSYVPLQGGAATGLCGGAQTPPCAVVKASPQWAGAYDECGAWLNSALVQEDNRPLPGINSSALQRT